jgi:hypothetical protein
MSAFTVVEPTVTAMDVPLRLVFCQPLPPDTKKNRTYAKKRKKRAKTQPPSREFDYAPRYSGSARWAGICPVAHGGQFRFLAGAVPGLRYHRGPRMDRSPTPLGDYLRRMKTKIGPQAAHTATAHKIAVIF